MDNKNKELQTLYTKHFNDVYRFAYFKLSNKEEAEDITSETFTKLMKEKDLNKILNKKAWLITVARNMVYNKYKQSKAIVMPQDNEGGYAEFKEVGHKSLEDEVISEELMEIIKKEIGKLDETSAEIIALKVWEELKFAEIAEITKLNESTVKLKYYRGIDKIKANIEGSNVKLRSFTLPILLAGIDQFGLVEMFKPEVEFVRNATKALFGAVNVSIIQKIMTKETVAAGAGVGIGAGTTAAAVSGGVLSTSLGKVLLGLGGALVIGTAGVAGINLARQEQPKPTPIEEEKPVENEKPPEEIKETLKFSSKHFNWSFEYNKVLGEVKSKYEEAPQPELQCKTETLDFPNFDVDLRLVTGAGECVGGFGGENKVDEQKLKTKDGREFKITYFDEGDKLRAMTFFNFNSSGNPLSAKILTIYSSFDKSKLAFVKQNMEKIVTTMIVSDKFIKTYTNKNYPKFNFKYDNSNWTLEENLITESGVKKTRITLISEKIEMYFDLYALDIPLDAGGPLNCYNVEHKVVTNSIFRIESYNENHDEHYYTNTAVKVGSKEYYQYEGIGIENKDNNPNLCFANAPSFLTSSKYATSNKQTPIHIYIKEKLENDLQEADQVISTLNWK